MSEKHFFLIFIKYFTLIHVQDIDFEITAVFSAGFDHLFGDTNHWVGFIVFVRVGDFFYNFRDNGH